MKCYKQERENDGDLLEFWTNEDPSRLPVVYGITLCDTSLCYLIGLILLDPVLLWRIPPCSSLQTLLPYSKDYLVVVTARLYETRLTVRYLASYAYCLRLYLTHSATCSEV